ncbi:hypothetical protein F5148DRAFT_538234 [Russula earlei]|uniref:Uncharacterized protein n=1 Tax=Russula earlei TaxID=71964 RepID=A0ACC0TWE7_9AGAM|nr:hypothetical protein F5148DRAFT_538234 [Russula earlei]
MRTSAIVAFICLAIGVAPSISLRCAHLFEFHYIPQFILHCRTNPSRRSLNPHDEGGTPKTGSHRGTDNVKKGSDSRNTGGRTGHGTGVNSEEKDALEFPPFDPPDHHHLSVFASGMVNPPPWGQSSFAKNSASRKTGGGNGHGTGVNSEKNAAYDEPFGGDDWSVFRSGRIGPDEKML